MIFLRLIFISKSLVVKAGGFLNVPFLDFVVAV